MDEGLYPLYLTRGACAPQKFGAERREHALQRHDVPIGLDVLIQHLFEQRDERAVLPRRERRLEGSDKFGRKRLSFSRPDRSPDRIQRASARTSDDEPGLERCVRKRRSTAHLGEHAESAERLVTERHVHRRQRRGKNAALLRVVEPSDRNIERDVDSPLPQHPGRLKDQKVARRAERIEVPAGHEATLVEELDRRLTPFGPRRVEADKRRIVGDVRLFQSVAVGAVPLLRR